MVRQDTRIHTYTNAMCDAICDVIHASYPSLVFAQLGQHARGGLNDGQCVVGRGGARVLLGGAEVDRLAQSLEFRELGAV